CESLLDGLANREHLGEPGDPEDLEYAFLAADELNRPIMLADPFQTADQHTEPGGVEELHSTDVDDDVVMTGVDEFEQRLPQSRRGVDVNFPGHLDDRIVAPRRCASLCTGTAIGTERRTALESGGQRQIHSGCLLSVEAPTRWTTPSNHAARPKADSERLASGLTWLRRTEWQTRSVPERETLIEVLTAGPHRVGRVTHTHFEAARPARTAPWPDWIDPAVGDRFVARGIERLWAHQAAAADLAWSGRSVAVATGTASGKSAAYLIPALTAARQGSIPSRSGSSSRS